VVVLSLICFGFFPELGGPKLRCFYPILGPQKKFYMSHRHQDIPIRPRYGYVDEESGQAEGAAGRPGSGATPASSYTEIPFLAQYPGAVPEHVLQDLTPTASGHPVVPGKGTAKGPNGESYVNLDSGEDDPEEEDDPLAEEDNSNSNSNSKDSSADIQRHRARAESSMDPEVPLNS